eukprot:3922349-Pyramimonas_sp.AAC.1
MTLPTTTPLFSVRSIRTPIALPPLYFVPEKRDSRARRSESCCGRKASRRFPKRPPHADLVRPCQLSLELASDWPDNDAGSGVANGSASTGSLALYTRLFSAFASAPHLLPLELRAELLEARPPSSSLQHQASLVYPVRRKRKGLWGVVRALAVTGTIGPVKNQVML